MNEETATGSSQKPAGAGWRIGMLVACLAVAAVVIGNDAIQTWKASAADRESMSQGVRAMGLVEPRHKTLAVEFTDHAGRMLADPPTSADQVADPSTLVIAHVMSTDAETPTIDWADLESHLASATGRQIVDEVFENSPEQLARIKQGEIHIVALHAADTPFLVNSFGFQPAAVLGDDSGANGNHLDIMVPADSSITQLTQLKGESLVCTVPSSITGYRAAIVMLAQDQSLRPNIDYQVIWSLSQKKSILGVASGEYKVAAISDDKLQSMLQQNLVASSSYRIIYHSDAIPRTTIGCFYNLKPDLAATVRSAILSWVPKSQPSSTQPRAADADPVADADTASAKPLHFLPIDYKKDFAFVREMDDRFDFRLNGKPKAGSTPATLPAVEAESVSPQ